MLIYSKLGQLLLNGYKAASAADSAATSAPPPPAWVEALLREHFHCAGHQQSVCHVTSILIQYYSVRMGGRKHQKYLTSDFFSTGQGVLNTGLGPCSPAPVEVSAGGGAEVRCLVPDPMWPGELVAWCLVPVVATFGGKLRRRGGD